MQESLDALVDTFSRLDRRPAVFDREIRKQLGLWRLADPVPIEEIVGAFKQHGAFTQDGTKVVVPLHEQDSAELTGEFLVYRPDQLVPCMVYYEFSRGKLMRIPFDEFASTYPAWRLRYWHPEYTPPTPPSYQLGSIDVTDTESGPDAEVTAAASEEAALGDDVEPADDIVASLRSFVERERESNREEARNRFNRLSPKEFQRTAGGIPELVPAGIDIDEYGQQSVKLRIPSEAVDGPVDITGEYGIYPGSEVLIGALDDEPGFPVEAEVLDIEGRELALGVYWNRGGTTGTNETAFELESGLCYSLGELLNPVPFDRELDAINIIESDDRKRGMLSGETTLSFQSSLDVAVDKGNLNNDQYQAAVSALRAEDVYCIHGPPGTGKTRTLIEIIKAACADGQRVLACAHSNQAVDNLLVGDSTADTPDESSLHAAVVDGDLSAARVGDNSTSSLVADEYADADSYQSDVVCATMSGAHTFGENIFDLAVVDEATQATTTATMIPFSRAKRLVLAGDHKQLPPYHSSERSENEEMDISLFEHLLGCYGEEIVTTLRVQYRMNQDIAAFPNQEFYSGQLTHGPRNRIWSLSTFFPLEAYHVEGEEQSTPGNSLYNDQEIDVVLAELSELLESGVNPGAIGVITPYAGQASKIRGKLATLDFDGLRDSLLVDTVDSFQGSERDVIIISFVRSNPQGWAGFLEFPNEGPRRLNVALTRAKKRCVLVGNFDTLRTRSPDKKSHQSAADVYQRLYEHLDEVGAFSTPPSR